MIWKAAYFLDFGNRGRLVLPYVYMKQIDVQLNKRIIVYLTTSNQLVRYLPDGTLDPTFGTKGFLMPAGMKQENGFLVRRNRLNCQERQICMVKKQVPVFTVYKPCFPCSPVSDSHLNITNVKKALTATSASFIVFPNPAKDMANIQVMGSAALN